MALRLAGEEIGIQEKIESISYTPGLQDSGDLETGTKTIMATSEASGLANADYSQALTLAKPDDIRLVVKRIAARLAVTVDSFDAATHLYCRVYVDVQDANHLLFDEDWSSIGAKLDAVDTHSGTLATIFDLLKDGAAHTFYFFFWIDQANNAVISLAQLWEAIGTCSTSGGQRAILGVSHTGFMYTAFTMQREGTGTGQASLQNDAAYASSGIWPIGLVDTSGYVEKISFTSANIASTPNTPVDGGVTLQAYGSVATDLNLLYRLKAILRSAQ